MCLGLSQTNIANIKSDDKETQLRALFDPLVKPEMKESWERQWKMWFVTTNSVEDLRKPGKLKGSSFSNFWNNLYTSDEFILHQGRFLALSPKTYFCYNAESEKTKMAYKGNWYLNDIKIGTNC